MSNQDRSGDKITGTIRGNVSGQAAIGKNITQNQSIGAPVEQVTEEHLETLRTAFAELKAQVEAVTPDEQRPAALERVNELEQAITEDKPDLSTMEYVRNWFVRNVPSLAGAVSSVIVNPIVGGLVKAVGDDIFEEFQRRFGGT